MIKRAASSTSSLGEIQSSKRLAIRHADPNNGWVWKDDCGWIRKELAADDHLEPADPDHEDPVKWQDENYDMDSTGKEGTWSWNEPKVLKMEGDDAEAWDDHDDHGRAEQVDDDTGDDAEEESHSLSSSRRARPGNPILRFRTRTGRYTKFTSARTT